MTKALGGSGRQRSANMGCASPRAGCAVERVGAAMETFALAAVLQCAGGKVSPHALCSM